MYRPCGRPAPSGPTPGAFPGRSRNPALLRRPLARRSFRAGRVARRCCWLISRTAGIPGRRCHCGSRGRPRYRVHRLKPGGRCRECRRRFSRREWLDRLRARLLEAPAKNSEKLPTLARKRSPRLPVPRAARNSSTPTSPRRAQSTLIGEWKAKASGGRSAYGYCNGQSFAGERPRRTSAAAHRMDSSGTVLTTGH